MQLEWIMAAIYSYCGERHVNIEAFSLCVFTSTKSPRGPPWNEGHRPKVRHIRPVYLEVPAQCEHYIEHSLLLKFY